MADQPGSKADSGLSRADRARALGLILKRHGEDKLQPTVPTRVDLLRDRTHRIETWEVVAWLPFSSEYIAWRRDTNYDNRLKAKEIEADDDGGLNGLPIPRTDEWTEVPIFEEVELVPEIEATSRPSERRAVLNAMMLGLTDPNSDELAKLGKKPS